MCKSILLVFSLSIIFFLSACSEKKPSESESADVSAPAAVGKSQAEIDDEKIQAYLKANGITNVQSTETGLYYTIENPGTGEHPTVNSQVIMHYRGVTLNGDVFDSSYDSGEPLDYPLSNLILGWRQGVPLIGRGGKATLYIPSALAYGPNARSSLIGPNEVLIFDVELLDFK
ncbi:MAG: FKBP-type peptidyl-prolyl cis-trans isomerase [Bacteroidia bacterium]|nr:FKBP-type peptidyl-prolyl cis-trans isomerase [Bacteroidia bacterium]